MKLVPEINHLEELDPTHMLWEDEGGKVTGKEEEPLEWPVFDDAKGG